MRTMTHIENDGKHIDRIIEETNCRRHGVLKGFSCFHIMPDSNPNRLLLGVCGPRIERAGFVGKIDPRSMRAKSPGPRSGPRGS